MDAFGLDICVQNTASVGGWHKRIAVGDLAKPESLYGQSFGMRNVNGQMDGSSASFDGRPNAGLAGSGSVYEDKGPATKTTKRFKTTPDEDTWATIQLIKEFGNRGDYHWLTRNCRGYSEDKYDELVKRIRERRGEKPPIIRSPKDQGNQGNQPMQR